MQLNSGIIGQSSIVSPHSSYFNPIECLWNIFQTVFNCLHSASQLWTAFEAAFTNLSSQQLLFLRDAKSGYVIAVIPKKGIVRNQLVVLVLNILYRIRQLEFLTHHMRNRVSLGDNGNNFVTDPQQKSSSSSSGARRRDVVQMSIQPLHYTHGFITGDIHLQMAFCAKRSVGTHHFPGKATNNNLLLEGPIDYGYIAEKILAAECRKRGSLTFTLHTDVKINRRSQNSNKIFRAH